MSTNPPETSLTLPTRAHRLYCSEIAPLEYRHIGGAFTAAGEWLMTFITVFAGRMLRFHFHSSSYATILTIIPAIGFDSIGWYFWLWVISGNVVAIIFVFLLCPETGGKVSNRKWCGPEHETQTDMGVHRLLDTRASRLPFRTKGLCGSPNELRCHGGRHGRCIRDQAQSRRC